MTTVTNGVDELVARFRMATTIMRALCAAEHERARVLELLGLPCAPEHDAPLVTQTMQTATGRSG